MSWSNLTIASEETKYPPKMSQRRKITNVTHAVITEKVVPDTKIMHKKKKKETLCILTFIVLVYYVVQKYINKKFTSYKWAQ